MAINYNTAVQRDGEREREMRYENREREALRNTRLRSFQISRRLLVTYLVVIMMEEEDLKVLYSNDDRHVTVHVSDQKPVEVWSTKRVLALMFIVTACVATLCTCLTFYLHPDFGTERNEFPVDPLPPEPTITPADARINCIPDRNVEATPQLCESRGCTWESTEVAGAPWCFFPAGYGAYRLVSEGDFSWGKRLTLERYDNVPSLFGGHIQTVLLDIEMQTDKRLHFKFYDNKNPRFEVPLPILPRPVDKATDPDYEVTYTTNPFTLQITRKATGQILWDTSIGALIMEDQFLSISTRLPSANLYGFGEHEHRSFQHDMNWNTWGMFARDNPPGDKVNLYGVHPFYLNVEYDGNAHGVLLFNLNAQDVTVQPTPALTYRTVGGILDFYLFLGPTPDGVIQQYTELVGRPLLPPYWSLGYHLSRYGYGNLTNLRAVVDSMRKYDIPHDVQYSDIDYMERSLDFTIDEENYAGIGEFVESLKPEGTNYIIMLDPAISANETGYEPFDLGVERDVFIRDENGDLQYGKVWPSYPNVTINSSVDWDTGVELYRAYAVFPDFLKSATKEWWTDQMAKFKERINFDALWIDMNEPASFVHGSVTGCPFNRYDFPPYEPHISNGGPIFDKTLCMNSVQDDGRGNTELHYNMHNLYGWSQTVATVDAVRELTGTRSLVLPRSTVPGSGMYAAHWLGDNWSGFPSLAYSIIGTLEFNLFGIPFVGADICGFFNDCSEELCLRWHQAGAFYPLARNHNGLNYQPQHPGYYDEPFPSRVRDVLHTRYRMLPYLYTLFYYAHTRGSTVVRSLMHEFPSDSHALAVDRQFMWGPALLISPVLEEGATSVRTYFPEARWYDYYDGTEVAEEDLAVGGGVWLNASLEHINLHVRGGYIIPTQQPHNSTKFSRQNPFGLIVSLDSNLEASGSLFWDDGTSDGTVEDGEYFLTRYSFSANILSSSFVHVPSDTANDLLDNLVLDDITIYGLRQEPSEVRFHGNPVPFEFSGESQVLYVRDLDHAMTEIFTLTVIS